MTLSEDVVNDQALDRLANKYGMTPEQARAVADVVTPEYALRLEQRTLSRGGLADVVALVGQAEQERQADDDEIARWERLGPAATQEVFGGADKTLFLADRAARQAGVETEKVEHMLPALNGLATQRLAERTQPQFNQLFDTLPGGTASSAGGAIPNQQPLPVPGDTGSQYGQPGGRAPSRYDDLSDVLRKQRRRLPNSGGSLGRSLRDILGTGLGNRSSGIVGWIIRFIIARFGWRIMKWMFSRMFTRR